ncbi:MAG: hypothetical protein WC759_03375 [Candidatus Micrarchaeia archaeon]|jgi:hypothetical protein
MVQKELEHKEKDGSTWALLLDTVIVIAALSLIFYSLNMKVATEPREYSFMVIAQDIYGNDTNGGIAKITFDADEGRGLVYYRPNAISNLSHLQVQLPSIMRLKRAILIDTTNESQIVGVHTYAAYFDLKDKENENFTRMPEYPAMVVEFEGIMMPHGAFSLYTLSSTGGHGLYDSSFAIKSRKMSCAEYCFSPNSYMPAKFAYVRYPEYTVFNVSTDSGADSRGNLVFTLNTFNASLKEEKDLLFSLGLALLAGFTLVERVLGGWKNVFGGVINMGFLKDVAVYLVGVIALWIIVLYANGTLPGESIPEKELMLSFVISLTGGAAAIIMEKKLWREKPNR